MSFITQVLALLLLAGSFVWAEPTTLIVGGRDAYTGQFPYQVWIYHGNFPQIQTSKLCGGSILNKEWVITSAGCILSMPVNGKIEVKAGKHEVDNDSEFVQTSDILIRIIHNDYKLYGKEIKAYDIGLLKLRTPFIFSDRVQSVTLPRPYIRPKGQGTLTGWGSISQTSTPNLPRVLQFTPVQILTKENCQNALKVIVPDENINDLQFCSGPLDSHISACAGDFGGPLIKYENDIPVQIGIASWSHFPCGNIDNPTIYTLVSAFVYWIEMRIEENQ